VVEFEEIEVDMKIDLLDFVENSHESAKQTVDSFTRDTLWKTIPTEEHSID
jgi:hypothetical protein